MHCVCSAVPQPVGSTGRRYPVSGDFQVVALVGHTDSLGWAGMEKTQKVNSI